MEFPTSRHFRDFGTVSKHPHRAREPGRPHRAAAARYRDREDAAQDNGFGSTRQFHLEEMEKLLEFPAAEVIPAFR